MKSAFPFSNYKQAWIDFRDITNETSSIAQHLIQHTGITKKRSILDLGGGDGSLLKKILNHPKSFFDKALLVEIERELISKAQENLRYNITQTDFINKDLKDINWASLNSYDAILASHVFYLIEESYVSTILKRLPIGASLYIILDEQNSVFDSFWVHTAPFYHEKLKKIHTVLSGLPKENFSLKKSVIKAQMKSPFSLPEAKRINVFSLLCYKDINELYNENPLFFDDTIQKFYFNGKVNYSSYCYEIIKIKHFNEIN